ncbi:MAG: hypothetical protein J6D47_12780 [Peptostreptococcaceae bacterium]|nr:hypothetical protein [Peptostreptococcaceae bacterium]
MVIKTTLTVSGYKAKLSPKLQLFQGDIVFVEFTLINSVISSINGVDVEECLPLSALTDVKLKLITPEGEETLESVKIVENRARFKITASNVIGDYDFQLTCYDSDGCTFKLPPASYTIAAAIGEIYDS